MTNEQNPYPLWDVALSIGEDPKTFIEKNIKAHNEKFDAKQHWINTFGTEPPKDYLNITNENT